jgi:hypothetical protein
MNKHLHNSVVTNQTINQPSSRTLYATCIDLYVNVALRIEHLTQMYIGQTVLLALLPSVTVGPFTPQAVCRGERGSSSVFTLFIYCVIHSSLYISCRNRSTACVFHLSLHLTVYRINLYIFLGHISISCELTVYISRTHISLYLMNLE